MHARRVAVTGASGFVGRAVAARLRAVGTEVVGIDRAGADGVLAGDLRVEGAWQGAVAACDAVVHTAALVSQTASRRDAWVANVVATRRVLDAVAPGKRVVHLSSAAIYSPHRPAQVDESFPVRPTGRSYGDTKIASEQVVLQAHAAGEVDAVILRPGDVYGTGSRPWTEVPIEALRAGRLVLPAHGRGLVDPVHIDDLVECIVVALGVDSPASRVFNAAGGAPLEAAAFFGGYSTRLGLRPARRVSTRAATLMAEALGRTQRLLGSPSELGTGVVAMLAKTGSLSIERAERELGWSPRVSLDAGMDAICARRGSR
ncbi:MAG: putative oxidoreductase [Acidimicrobiia bacterium]